MKTSDEIKQLRKALGLNQSEFATRIGVSDATVSRWESGNRRPTKLAQREFDRLARRVTPNKEGK